MHPLLACMWMLVCRGCMPASTSVTRNPVPVCVCVWCLGAYHYASIPKSRVLVCVRCVYAYPHHIHTNTFPNVADVLVVADILVAHGTMKGGGVQLLGVYVVLACTPTLHACEHTALWYAIVLVCMSTPHVYQHQLIMDVCGVPPMVS